MNKFDCIFPSREDVELAEDLTIWKQEIEEEIEELRDEHERQYRHDMITFEEHSKRYENQQIAKVI